MFTKKFWKAAVDRAIRTMAQAVIACAPTTYFTLSGVNWIVVGSTALGAGIISIVTSAASGLPEAKE